jgi:hypothetical protein
MATASGSLGSHEVRKRLRPNLPLIPCGECKKKIVLEYQVKKECPNKGRIFYMCPDRNVSCFLLVCLLFVAIFCDDFD